MKIKMDAEQEEEMENNACKFAEMLMRDGQGEEELAYYIQRTWQENPNCMEHDIKTMKNHEEEN